MMTEQLRGLKLCGTDYQQSLWDSKYWKDASRDISGPKSVVDECLFVGTLDDYWDVGIDLDEFVKRSCGTWAVPTISSDWKEVQLDYYTRFKEAKEALQRALDTCLNYFDGEEPIVVSALRIEQKPGGGRKDNYWKQLYYWLRKYELTCYFGKRDNLEIIAKRLKY